MNKRISFAAKILKIGPIVTAIILLSYVVDFYEEVALAKCSDPITNEAFVALGNTLPPTQWNNIATLCMDFLQITLPSFFLYLKWRKEQKMASEAMKVDPLQHAALQKRHQESSNSHSPYLNDLILPRDDEYKSNIRERDLNVHNEDMYESISIRTPCRSETFREKEIRNFKAPKEAFGVVAHSFKTH